MIYHTLIGDIEVPEPFDFLHVQATATLKRWVVDAINNISANAQADIILLTNSLAAAGHIFHNLPEIQGKRTNSMLPPSLRAFDTAVTQSVEAECLALLLAENGNPQLPQSISDESVLLRRSTVLKQFLYFVLVSAMLIDNARTPMTAARRLFISCLHEVEPLVPRSSIPPVLKMDGWGLVTAMGFPYPAKSRQAEVGDIPAFWLFNWGVSGNDPYTYVPPDVLELVWIACHAADREMYLRKEACLSEGMRNRIRSVIGDGSLPVSEKIGAVALFRMRPNPATLGLPRHVWKDAIQTALNYPSLSLSRPAWHWAVAQQLSDKLLSAKSIQEYEAINRGSWELTPEDAVRLMSLTRSTGRTFHPRWLPNNRLVYAAKVLLGT